MSRNQSLEKARGTDPDLESSSEGKERKGKARKPEAR
jgi:hypothetical protein